MHSIPIIQRLIIASGALLGKKPAAFSATAGAAMGQKRPSERPVIAMLIIAWILLACLVNPVGNFPLNDDWSYAQSVKVLLEEHRLIYTGWSSMTLFFHVIYGALFCLPFGFSFTALRISTLMMGIGGIVGLYILLRQIDTPRFLAVCGSLTLMFNPIYYVNCFNFMTDVPFAALTVIACIFFLRALRTHSRRDEITGFIVLALATLIRQISFPITLAYGLVVILKEGFSFKTLLRASWPTVGIALLLAVYNYSTDALGITPELTGSKEKEIQFMIAKIGYLSYASFIVNNILSSLIYLSAFTLPLNMWLIFIMPKVDSMSWKGSSAGLFDKMFFLYLVIAADLIYIWFMYWWLGNNMYVAYMAPITAFNSSVWINHIRQMLPYTDRVITVIVSISTIVFIYVIATGAHFLLHDGKLKSLKNNFHFQVSLFSLLVCAGLFLPFSLMTMFDRYLLPAIPFAVLFLAAFGRLVLSGAHLPEKNVASVAGKGVAMFSFGFLIFMGAASVVATHDYLAWHRPLWQAVDELVNKKGIPPEVVDGGLEVTGWNLYSNNKEIHQRFNNWYTIENAFSILNQEYVIGFYEEPFATTFKGKGMIATYPIATWLPSKALRMAVYH